MQITRNSATKMSATVNFAVGNMMKGNLSHEFHATKISRLKYLGGWNILCAEMPQTTFTVQFFAVRKFCDTEY